MREGVTKRDTEAGPAPAPEPVAAEIVADLDVQTGEQLTLERLIDMWPNVRADVKSLDRRIEALMLEIDPVEISDNRITLVSQYEFHRNMLNDSSRRSVIESVVTRRAGQPYRVEVVLRTEFEASLVRNAPSASTVEREAEAVPPALLDDSPVTEEQGEKFLGAVIRMFDGEIVDETIDQDQAER